MPYSIRATSAKCVDVLPALILPPVESGLWINADDWETISYGGRTSRHSRVLQELEHDTDVDERSTLRLSVLEFMTSLSEAQPDSHVNFNLNLTISLAIAFFLLDKVDGFRREFSLENTSLRHPFAVHERIPNTILICICFVAPIAIMPIINFISVRSWWDLHNSSLGLVLSLALTGSITQLVKITVGRPRPDVISRCEPIAGSVDPTLGLSNSSICTQTDHAILIDGFRSFFSGHSSLSFAGMGFLAYYLAGKLHLFDKRGHTGKAWLALAPFMVALLVAISRTMDYRHYWQDVLVGSIVGTTLSFFSYRQYYPSLASEWSHRPYSPRIKREDDILPSHIQPALPGTNSPHHLDVDSAHPYRQQHSFDEAYELAGTVPCPQTTSLEDSWKHPGTDDSNDHGDFSSTAYNPSDPAKRMGNQLAVI